jgi:DNA-binding protein HU-beta
MEKRMNKTQLVEYVAKTLGNSAAPGAVEAVLDAIARELASGGSVLVTGFGTFETIKRAPRMGRNPQTGVPVAIPSRTEAKFRPGQNLQELVNGDRAVPLDGSAIAKAPKGSLSGGAR